MNKSTPTSTALNIINEQHIIVPEDIRDLDTLVGLASCYNVHVRCRKLSNCSARISMLEDRGVITYDDETYYEPRIKFSIAHELGHFFLHRLNPHEVYEDTDADFRQKGRRSNREAEADEFASELLMPTPLFIESIKMSGLMDPDFNLARYLASDFNVSLTAASMQLVSCRIYCCALVVAKDGQVCWFHADPKFKYRSQLFDVVRNQVPPNSYISDYYENGITDFQADEIDAVCWFPDTNISEKLFEHSLPIPANNRSLTLLWY